MRSKSKVYFFFDNVAPDLRNRAGIKRTVELIFRKEKKKLDRLNYVFSSDRTLLALNKQYLNHNYYTDIVSFDLSETKDLINGEIYISVDRVRENAAALNNPIYREFLRVIFHGALHLCGYKDKKPGEQKKMRQKEEFYLKAMK